MTSFGTRTHHVPGYFDANMSSRHTEYASLQLKSRTPVWRANGEQHDVAGKSSEPETGDMRHSRFHFPHHRAHPELAYSFVVQSCTSITL